MVNLKEIEEALNAPGFVTSTQLTFNRLKYQLAQNLCITIDHPIFEEHKNHIKDCYRKTYIEKFSVPAPTSELPKRGRELDAAEAAATLKHPSKFSRLTIAELHC